MSRFQTARFGASEDVTITGTSATSAAINDQTTTVRLVADTDCRVRHGASPTAVATDTLMPAGHVEYIHIGGGEQIAVIGTSGVLNVTQVSK